MRARRLGGASDLRERNRASWTADDQYRWNGFVSVVIASCPSAIILMVIFKCYFFRELIALSHNKSILFFPYIFTDTYS